MTQNSVCLNIFLVSSLDVRHCSWQEIIAGLVRVEWVGCSDRQDRAPTFTRHAISAMLTCRRQQFIGTVVRQVILSVVEGRRLSLMFWCGDEFELYCVVHGADGDDMFGVMGVFW